MPSAFDKLYWMRISFGVLAGFFAEFAFRLDYFDGLLVGVLFYLASYYVGRYLFFRSIAPEKVGKLYTTGVGGYAMLFVFTWVLLFTISVL